MLYTRHWINQNKYTSSWNCNDWKQKIKQPKLVISQQTAVVKLYGNWGQQKKKKNRVDDLETGSMGLLSKELKNCRLILKYINILQYQ
jgi:hypothetical protein